MADDATLPDDALAMTARVLLVVDDAALARFDAIAKHIVIALADTAARVTVLARTTRSPEALELGPCTVIHTPPARWPFRTRLPKAALSLLAEHKIDVIHCLSVDLLRWMLKQPETLGTPIATHVTDRIDLGMWLRQQTARPDLFGMPATPSLFQAMLADKRVPTSQLKLVPLGMLRQAGAPIRVDQPDHIPSAVIISPLTRDAGLDHVFRAMAQVTAASKRELALFVIGKGPAERRLRRLAGELKLHAGVTFVGSIRQWVEALVGSDLALFARSQTRWDSKRLQAMAAGRVILAPHGDDAEGLVDGQNALLFTPGDVAELAGRWQRAIAEPGFAVRLADAAQAYVKAHHSLSSMGSAILDVYQQATGEPAPAPT